MAKTRGAAGVAMTEAPHQGDPLEEQVVEEAGAERAAEEPATQPIVAEAGADPVGYVHLASERPGVNDRSGATDEAIARRAYELYQARGGSHGADMDDWLQAERELHTERGPAYEGEHAAHRPID